jgi:hypothetical protein
MTKYHQIPLFDRPTFNTIKQQKEAMNLAARRSQMSREQIVDGMNELAERYGVALVANGALSLETFEKWINPGDLSRQMPMKALPIFCAIVRDNAALDVMARPVGAAVIGPEDQNLLKWARAYFRARDARNEMRAIESEL